MAALADIFVTDEARRFQEGTYASGEKETLYFFDWANCYSSPTSVILTWNLAVASY